MPHYLTLRFDITGFTPRQIERLKRDAMKQAQSTVDEVCHFCGQVLEDGECGGEGEGSCSEFSCVSLYKRATLQAPKALAVYVREFCDQTGIENTLVPYRNDGLTYFQQLAYMVADYNDLPAEAYEEAKKLLGLEAA